MIYHTNYLCYHKFQGVPNGIANPLPSMAHGMWATGSVSYGIWKTADGYVTRLNCLCPFYIYQCQRYPIMPKSNGQGRYHGPMRCTNAYVNVRTLNMACWFGLPNIIMVHPSCSGLLEDIDDDYNSGLAPGGKSPIQPSPAEDLLGA